MIWLWLGLALWVVLHFIPSLAAGLRASLIARVGETPYKLAFTVGVIAAIVLMVIGWRAAVPTAVYTPPTWGPSVAGILILIAFLLFAFARAKTNVKRALRHPQLTGLVVWAIAHLLANGDNRSLVLFGVLGIWALVEMPLINRRDGPWQRPEPAPAKAVIPPAIAGIVIFAVFLVAHPFLFGVAPFPR